MKWILALLIFMSTPVFGQTQKHYPSSAVSYYLRHLAAQFVGRPLNKSEINLVETKRETAIAEVIENWMKNDFFVKSSRRMLETQLTTSGATSTVDFGLPGNLMEYIVTNKLPLSEIVTANYCVKNGQKTECDSGAPYAAGVLTTKAFLVSNDGRFNLSRAGKMLKQFTCQEYPLEVKLQIPILRERMIPMFQVDESDAGDFGNGVACYRCHSQFGAHAQLFVKFSGEGRYIASATGEQDPNQEMGKSFSGTYTSHLEGSEKSSEASQMFGDEVANLAEAAKVMASNPLFLSCSIRNVLKHFLRVSYIDSKNINEPLLTEISQKILNIEKEPTLNTILLQTLTHPLVIDSVLVSGVKNEI
ncbi:MAG: hypothetical protein KDD61_10620 [Bdellovibrionales bacterium]|nr:hypothetical protein [Bdellovibrionales bacterium]